MRVYEFGGSCLTTPASLDRVRALIERGGGPPLVCVFSALQGVTDRLLDMARDALRTEPDTSRLLAEHAAYLAPLPPRWREPAEARLGALAEELRRTLIGVNYLQDISPRIRDRVAARRFLSSAGHAVRLTASFGVAAYPQHATAMGDLLAVADRALFSAKAAGRSRIQAAGSEAPARRPRASGGARPKDAPADALRDE